MNSMTKEQLVDNLESYGYRLLKPAFNKQEELLENLLEQDDVRLLEGFPVVFANVLKEKEELDWENNNWHPDNLSKKAQKRLLYFLAFVSFLLEMGKVGESYENRVSKLLSKFPNGKQLLGSLYDPFMRSEPVEVGGVEFSTERLKTTFLTYTLQPTKSDKLKDKKQVLEQELLLSEIFTPHQKVLLRKKSEGQPLTKTEREYFSRVVKKRLRVLADDEVHEFAHRLFHA